MKKLSFILALLLTVGALASCGEGSDTTTEAAKNDAKTTAAGKTEGNDPAKTDPTDSDPTATPTGGQTTPQPGETTDGGSGAQPSEPQAALDYPADDVYRLPGGKAGDLDLEGYDASSQGMFDIVDGKLTAESDHAMFIVTNDRMSAGKLTATFTSLAGSDSNDNGIIFGMEDITEEDAFWFWEDVYYAPQYYFLFVSDQCTLYLAKVAWNGEAWHEIQQSSSQIIGYAHGGTITISVEFDGKGSIKCYAGDELLIEVQDSDGPTGDRYGVRCEHAGVVYHEVIAEHAED